MPMDLTAAEQSQHDLSIGDLISIDRKEIAVEDDKVGELG